MMLELARYKVQEKSLKLKVSSLQTSLSQQKSTSEAALKSASISTKQAVERAKEECGEIIGMYRDMIITLLCDNKLSRLSDNELVYTALFCYFSLFYFLKTKNKLINCNSVKIIQKIIITY